MSEIPKMKGKSSRGISPLLEWEDDSDKKERRLSDPSKANDETTSSSSKTSLDQSHGKDPKRPLFRTKSTASRTNTAKSPREGSKKKNKLEPIQENKPEVPMYVSDSWLLKWMKGSEDASQNWTFGYKKQKRQYFLPIELLIPMELVLFESTSKELGSMPVQFSLNGHVIRLFRSEDSKADQKLIITFNLKEITIIHIKGNKEAEKILLVSRFHGRVFILQNVVGAESQSMENIFVSMSVNCSWARKYSTLVYPGHLIAMLWKDKIYQTRDLIISQKNIGWGSYAGGSVYVKLDTEVIGQIELYKNEEENKAKLKIKAEGMEAFTNINSKSKGISFMVCWQKKKENLLMNEIAGFERIVALKEDSISSTIQNEISKLISNYESNPLPLEYKFHSQLYTSLKEEIMKEVLPTLPIDPTFSESRALALDADSQSELNAINKTDSSSSLSLITSKDLARNSSQSEVSSELSSIKDRINAIEERIPKRAQSRDKIPLSISDTQTKATITTILERLNTLETRVDRLIKPYTTPPTTPTSSDKSGRKERVSRRDRSTSRDALDNKLQTLTNMLESRNSEGQKVNRLDALDIRLAKVLSYLTRKEEYSPRVDSNSVGPNLVSVRLDQMESKFNTKHSALEEKLDNLVELLKKSNFDSKKTKSEQPEIETLITSLKTSIDDKHENLNTKLEDLSAKVQTLGVVCHHLKEKLKILG